LLTAERLRELLDYSAETGEFRWKKNLKGGVRAGAAAGCVDRRSGGVAYIRIRVDGKIYHAHRLAWLYVHGEWPAAKIDHKDGWSNAIANLRPATQGENVRNATLRVDNSSGFKGVVARGRKWAAQIQHGGRNHYLGVYADPREAAAAYDQQAAHLFGDFAKTNASLGAL
jgi:hypothetical protein